MVFNIFRYTQPSPQFENIFIIPKRSLITIIPSPPAWAIPVGMKWNLTVVFIYILKTNF